MNVIFFGTSSFGIPVLEALKRVHSLLAVVTTPDKPSGRHLKPQPSPVKQWAQANGVPAHDYLAKEPSAILPPLKGMRPDVFLVVSFGALLKSDFLSAPRHCCLNIHASLLPKYRGASPMQAALLNGDRGTGVSVMRMIERLDAGDVLLQKNIPVSSDDNILSLQARLSTLGAEAALEALDQLERGTARYTVQDEMGATYTRKIAKSEGRIEWPSNAWDIHHRVSAFLGWPGAHFFFRGKRILAWRSEIMDGPQSGAPGTVTDVSERGLAVTAGSGTGLRLLELQLEGKKRLLWTEFRKGFAIKTGDVLE